ncbi:hypothetical protein ACQJBY_003443 [Aegilops geniculata]
MALTMNKKATPMCLVALLLVMSAALLACHATARDIGPAEQWAKYCVAKPTCKTAPQPALDACRNDCNFFGYPANKAYCSATEGGICCCLR